MIKFLFFLIKKIFSLIFTIIFICFLIGLYAFFVEPNLIFVKDVDVSSDKINGDVKIAVIADTHLGYNYDIDNLSKVVDKINKQNPDIVLFAGDLIDDFSQYNQDTSEISNTLSKINSNYGKFAVFGNHDYGGGAERYYEQIMNDGGFNVLINENHYIEKLNLNILGIDDFLLGKGNIYTASALNSSNYNLVLCHEPDVYDNLKQYNIDSMVSGHSHGGQINIPFVEAPYLPSLASKYIKGKYESDNYFLYVSRGLGTTKVKARLLSPPEITIININ